MKISEKTITSINTKCKNGFRFSIQNFRERGDKELAKEITVTEDKEFIEVNLRWVNEVVHILNKHNCSIPHYTGKVIPQIRVSIWRRPAPDRLYGSHGLGATHQFADMPFSRRAINDLCKATEFVTDELIRSLLPEAMKDLPIFTSQK